MIEHIKQTLRDKFRSVVNKIKNKRSEFRMIAALIKKEFHIIWRDPKSRGIIIAMPIVQLILFANAITMEVRNIQVAVMDQDKTMESRELISKFEHSPQFKKIYYTDNMSQIQDLINKQEVSMGLCIKNDFAANIKANIPTDVLVITDGRQTNSAAIIAGYASQIIQGFNVEQIKNIVKQTPKINNSHNPSTNQNINQESVIAQTNQQVQTYQLIQLKAAKIAQSTGATINVIQRHWYNPNLDYRWYILTVIVVMLSVVLTQVLTAMSIAREREMGTFDQLIVSPLSATDILIGKSVPPLCISLTLSCLMSFIVTNVFGVPFIGSVASFLIAMIVSLMSIVGVGLYISSICKTQQQAIFGVIAFQMPAILLSGFISPIEDMPEILQYITYANPIRFFMALAREICLKGMNMIDIFIHSIPLIVIAVITLSLASWSFKRRLD